MLLEKWSKAKALSPKAQESARIVTIRSHGGDLLIVNPVKHPTPQESKKLMRDFWRVRAKMTGKGIKESGSDVLRKLRDGRLK